MNKLNYKLYITIIYVIYFILDITHKSCSIRIIIEIKGKENSKVRFHPVTLHCTV